jgi:hypothetical protein
MWAPAHISFHSHEHYPDDDRRAASEARRQDEPGSQDEPVIREALEAEIRRQRIREEEARHAEDYARNPVAPGEFAAWLSEQDWGAL